MRDPQEVVDDFHRLYYGPNNAMEFRARSCSFLGQSVVKCPTDLWAYQEILFDLKPDLIVECGSGCGGSAYYMACLMDLMHLKGASIISMDISPMKRKKHRRIQYVLCDSVEPSVVEDIQKLAKTLKGHILVILDSNHHCDHVLKELDAYHSIVTPDSYLIVEDSNINGHPVLPDYGPGPWEAVVEWLPQHPEFEVEDWWEKYLMTYNPGGYLKRRV